MGEKLVENDGDKTVLMLVRFKLQSEPDWDPTSSKDDLNFRHHRFQSSPNNFLPLYYFSLFFN